MTNSYEDLLEEHDGVDLLLLSDEQVVTPNPGGQQTFAEDWENFIVGLEGGWFSGKSFIGARKLTTLHLFNSFDKEGDPTYIPSACVAPTYSNAMDFCVPHLQDAIKESGLSFEWKNAGPIAEGRFSGPGLVLPDLGIKERPSVILIRTADVPQRITGWTVGAAWGDEPARWKEDRSDPRNDAFIQLLGRVRAPDARLLQILFTYTNEGDLTRIYEEMTSGRKDISLHRAATLENPYAEGFYHRTKKLLTKELVKQYLDGQALTLRGNRVYPSFEANLHVNKKLKLYKEHPLQLSLDFNINPGMHGEVGQYLTEKDLFTSVYELYAPRMSVRGLIKAFLELIERLGGWQWPHLEIFGDATGQSEWAGTGESCYSVLRNLLKEKAPEIPFTLKVPRSNPMVIDRVNAVEMALLDADDAIHFQIHPRCERLITDFKKLKYKDGEIDKSERKLSHPSDAEGYRVELLRPVRVSRPPSIDRFSVSVV